MGFVCNVGFNSIDDSFIMTWFCKSSFFVSRQLRKLLTNLAEVNCCHVNHDGCVAREVR